MLIILCIASGPGQTGVSEHIGNICYMQAAKPLFPCIVSRIVSVLAIQLKFIEL